MKFSEYSIEQLTKVKTDYPINGVCGEVIHSLIDNLIELKQKLENIDHRVESVLQMLVIETSLETH